MTPPTFTPRVLIFGEELRMRAARRVAVCAGAEVLLEEDPARISRVVEDTAPHIILFDFDHAGPAAMLLTEQVVNAAPAARMVLLCHPSPPAPIGRLLRASWFEHLLGLESPWFMDELGATLAKLSGRSPFGLETFLPWGSRVISTSVESSEDKARLFGRIEAFMGAIGMRGRLVRRLHDIADELLMNAVYDAPIDRRTGDHRYAALPRTTPVELAPADRPTFSFGSDGRVFGIGISDPFGGLRPRTLKNYIAKGLRRGDDQIDTKAGGAGLGLYFLFQSLNSMSLNLHPGQRTEMLGLVDIRGSFRDVLRSPKSFNIFVVGGES